MENQTNVGDQNTQQIQQNPVSQPVQIPEKPRINYLMISLVVLICFIVFGVGGYYLGKQNQNKTPYGGNILPTPIVTSPPKETVSPTTQPTTVKSVLETVTLKVAAIGGGINIDGYNFTFTFNKEPNDTVTILKRNENEYKNYQGFPQGAIDKGFVLKHGNITLEVSPAFEGAGSPLMQKPIPVIILNSKLAVGPIFRLKAVEIYGSQNIEGGSVYTTQYKDKPEDCTAWGTNVGQPNPPACIWDGAQVMTKGNNALAISCSAESNDANWCDNIVKSLSVSATKYTN